MTHHVEIIDGIGAGDHASDDRSDLTGRVGSLVSGHTSSFAHDAAQVARLGQPHHRLKPRIRHQIRIVERCPDLAGAV
jgi:hypothetical protein